LKETFFLVLSLLWGALVEIPNNLIRAVKDSLENLIVFGAILF
jgi:hypothetical protein